MKLYLFLGLFAAAFAAQTVQAQDADFSDPRERDRCYTYWVCDACSPAGSQVCYAYDSCTNTPTGESRYMACNPPHWPTPPVPPLPPLPPH